MLWTGVPGENSRRIWCLMCMRRRRELHGNLAGVYKVKLRKDGCRLMYQVPDKVIVIFVIAVGR